MDVSGAGIDRITEWWEADYSWDGLAQHSATIDGKTISLQDVFNDCRGNLATFDGRLFTPLHAPWFIPDRAIGSCPLFKKTALKSWIERLRHPASSQAICLSGAILDGSVILPKAAEFEVLVEQALIGGSLSLGSVKKLRIVRSFVGGNLRAPAPQFDDDVTIYSSRITGALSLQAGTFPKFVDLRDSDFGGEVNLSDGTFDGYAINLARSRFGAQISFSRSTVTGNMRLEEAHFEGDVLLNNATVRQYISADGATFRGLLSLNEATVHGDVSLVNADLDGGLSLDEGMIKGRLTATGKPNQHLAGVSARSARLNEQVGFDGRRFTGRMNFTGCSFGRPPLFHGSEFHSDLTFAKAEFFDVLRDFRRRQTHGREAHIFQRVMFRLGLAARTKQNGYNDLCEQVGSAYRTMRLAAANVKNVEYESRFYVAELKARRARTDVPLLERVLSKLYDVISVCGTSLTRPLIVMMALPLVSATILTITFYDFVQFATIPVILRFSARQMAPPPSVWTAHDLAMSGEPMNTIINQWPAPVFVLGTVTFIITATLTALLALALQRRFRQ